jgi:hypothetical protein
MQTSDVINLIGTTVSAAATVLLAVLTARYVKLTHALVDETRSAKFPNVFVDIEIDLSSVKFIVGNAGSSGALDIRLAVTDSVPWLGIGKRPTGIASLPIVQNGISYLAPGRILKFRAGHVKPDADFFAAGNTIEVELSFSTETGRRLKRQFSIDLNSYSSVLYESFRAPGSEVAEAIRNSERSRSLRESIPEPFFLNATKPCPVCAEQIPAAAKKCPRCHEFIQPGP